MRARNITEKEVLKVDTIFNYGMELAYGLITAGLTGALAQLNYRIKRRMLEQDAIKNGMQAILRDRIIQAYNHYVVKGWLPFYAMENVTHMYDAYHALGGNGAVTELYEKMLKMPQKEVDRHEL